MRIWALSFIKIERDDNEKEYYLLGDHAGTLHVINVVKESENERTLMVLSDISFSLNLHNKERITAMQVIMEENEIMIISIGRNGKINFSLFDSNSQGNINLVISFMYIFFYLLSYFLNLF